MHFDKKIVVPKALFDAIDGVAAVLKEDIKAGVRGYDARQALTELLFWMPVFEVEDEHTWQDSGPKDVA